MPSKKAPAKKSSSSGKKAPTDLKGLRGNFKEVNVVYKMNVKGKLKKDGTMGKNRTSYGIKGTNAEGKVMNIFTSKEKAEALAKSLGKNIQTQSPKAKQSKVKKPRKLSKKLSEKKFATFEDANAFILRKNRSCANKCIESCNARTDVYDELFLTPGKSQLKKAHSGGEKKARKPRAKTSSSSKKPASAGKKKAAKKTSSASKKKAAPLTAPQKAEAKKLVAAAKKVAAAAKKAESAAKSAEKTAFAAKKAAKAAKPKAKPGPKPKK